MAAPKGNTYWKLAKDWGIGADRKYTPDDLWTKALEYFRWVESHPLKEEKVFGTGLRMQVSKLRAMSIVGFCIFANIDRKTLSAYEADEAYLHITTRIRDIIYTQKFEGACADLLNSNIIARELGLTDRQDITSNGDSIASSSLNDESLDRLIAANTLLNGKQ